MKGTQNFTSFLGSRLEILCYNIYILFFFLLTPPFNVVITSLEQ